MRGGVEWPRARRGPDRDRDALRRGGAVDYDRFRELCRVSSSTTAPTGVVVAGTTGEAPTLSDDERLALIGAARRGGRRPGDRGRGDRHVLDRALGPSDRAGARRPACTASSSSRRTTTSRRSAGSSSTSRRLPTRATCRSSSTTSRPRACSTSRRRRSRAGRDPDRPRGQAGERRPRPGATRSSSSGSTSTRATTTSILPFVELGGLGGVCVHTHVVGPQVKEMVTALPRRRPRGGAPARRRRPRPPTRSSRCRRTRSQIKAALNLLGHDVGGLRLPLVEATEDEVAQVRDCLERLSLLEPSRA